MSEQLNDNESLVHCRQMSTADFDALAIKRPDTIYFVNETGVFTEQSLGEDGDIYLGEKLLTRKPDLNGVMKVNGTTKVPNEFTGSSFVIEYELTQNLAAANILDFFFHASLQHTNSTAVNVECWLETGHYEEEDGVLKYHSDFVVAATQTTLAESQNSSPVLANLSIVGSLNGPLQSKYFRVCFDSTDTITLKRYTANNDHATQVLIRTYSTLNT